MALPKTITIALSPDAAKVVQEALSSGAFSNESAVVDAALRDWLDGRADRLGYEWDELHALAEAGIASGPGEGSLEDIKREGFRRAGLPYPKA